MKQATLPATWKLHATLLILAGFILIVILSPPWLHSLSQIQADGLNLFKTMFISIVLEAMPFLLLGVFVSSFIHAFIPQSWIRRVIPRNAVIGVVIASLLGIVFPVCECGLIPVVRRLVLMGMPLYAGITFILAGPIVNPVVYSSTFAAFQAMPEMVYSRMGLAVAVSAVVGLIVYFFIKHNPMKQVDGTTTLHSHAVASPHIHRRRNKLEEAMQHAGGEFFDMGKYLILGSFITAVIQSFIPRSELLSIGQGEIGSHFFMMGFAFILSICSTSDAFVASSFLSTFSAGSLLTFLVFGPMVDFKGMLMLLSVFKTRFVFFLIAVVSVTVLAGSVIAGDLFFR